MGNKLEEIKNKNNKSKIKHKEKKNEKELSELENEIDYKYNEKGELVHKITGEKVGKLTQEKYEQVGLYVAKYLEQKLIKTFDLTTLYIPNKSKDLTKRDENIAQCKILTTKDFPSNARCLILIQGGGVKLGQWARSVCINENIYLGSMIPYVEKAINNGFSAIIFNPNEKTDFVYNDEKITEFTCLEEHCVYAYQNIVKKNKNIKEIYFVGHSVGGVCILEILSKNKDDLLKGKIKKIAFTDSIHHENECIELGEKENKKLIEISRNYVRSDKPAGTFLGDYKSTQRGVDIYSSGHLKHEYTSGTAVDNIFEFLTYK